MSGVVPLDDTKETTTHQIAGVKRIEPSESNDTEDEPQRKLTKSDISDTTTTEDNVIDPDVGDINQSIINIPKENHDEDLIEQNQYSDLQYIQSNGVLNQLRRIKHRGVTAMNVSSSSFDDTPQSSSSAAADLWDRPAYLKLSYRIRSTDNHIQFALIIYEAINRNPRSRRNLTDEFQMVVPKSSVRKKLVTASMEKDQTPSKEAANNKQVPSMKKSLRF